MVEQAPVPALERALDRCLSQAERHGAVAGQLAGHLPRGAEVLAKARTEARIRSKICSMLRDFVRNVSATNLRASAPHTFSAVRRAGIIIDKGRMAAALQPSLCG